MISAAAKIDVRALDLVTVENTIDSGFRLVVAR
jgi:hypothetical protein